MGTYFHVICTKFQEFITTNIFPWITQVKKRAVRQFLTALKRARDGVRTRDPHLGKQNPYLIGTFAETHLFMRETLILSHFSHPLRFLFCPFLSLTLPIFFRKKGVEKGVEIFLFSMLQIVRKIRHSTILFHTCSYTKYYTLKGVEFPFVKMTNSTNIF